MDGAGLRQSSHAEAQAVARRIDRIPRAPHAQSRRRPNVSRSRTISALRAVPVLLVLLTCCHGRDDGAPAQPRLLDATVGFPPRDTARFSLPASMHRCTDGRTMLLEAVSPEGNGVLLRLHFRDTLVAAAYPVVAPGDTTSPAAVVAVRYLLRDAARAFFFDSGAVQVRRERPPRQRGSGGAGVRTAARLH